MSMFVIKTRTKCAEIVLLQQSEVGSNSMLPLYF